MQFLSSLNDNISSSSSQSEYCNILLGKIVDVMYCLCLVLGNTMY